MSDVKKFVKDEWWVQVEGDVARFGISEQLQEDLGDITFVSLPVVGKTVKKGEAISELEAEKAVSELASPVNGVILAVNQEAEANPELLNSCKANENWLADIKLLSPISELV
ncbi:MAG: glycine cleavage system protein H [Lactobacillales bacterium]|jgi:glycine cleavage system H protein|nr:glycine cleavage system protein H [Lactobacillales bacterium]